MKAQKKRDEFPEAQEAVRCSLVGDAWTGKSSLSVRFAKNEFLEHYIKAIAEVYTVDLKVFSPSHSTSSLADRWCWPTVNATGRSMALRTGWLCMMSVVSTFIFGVQINCGVTSVV